LSNEIKQKPNLVERYELSLRMKVIQQLEIIELQQQCEIVNTLVFNCTGFE